MPSLPATGITCRAVMRGVSAVSAVSAGGKVFKDAAFRLGVGSAWVRERINGPDASILPQSIV
jgi:hypothetical protein